MAVALVNKAGILIPVGFGPMVAKALDGPLTCIDNDESTEVVTLARPRVRLFGIELANYMVTRNSSGDGSLVTVTFNVGLFSTSAAVREFNMWAINVVGMDEYAEKVAFRRSVNEPPPQYVEQEGPQFNVRLWRSATTKMKRVSVKGL